MATKTIKIGDYVQTSRRGIRGRAYKIGRLTEGADWIRGLTIPVTLEQIIGDWVGILCDDPTGKGHGGAILAPIDTCVKIPPIKGFYHICGKDEFGDK